jgi:hypothetical protein
MATGHCLRGRRAGTSGRAQNDPISQLRDLNPDVVPAVASASATRHFVVETRRSPPPTSGLNLEWRPGPRPPRPRRKWEGARGRGDKINGVIPEPASLVKTTFPHHICSSSRVNYR